MLSYIQHTENVELLFRSEEIMQIQLRWEDPTTGEKQALVCVIPIALGRFLEQKLTEQRRREFSQVKLTASRFPVEQTEHLHSMAASPQENSVCTQFHKQILEEFYRPTFSCKQYQSIAELQQDVDRWLKNSTIVMLYLSQGSLELKQTDF